MSDAATTTDETAGDGSAAGAPRRPNRRTEVVALGLLLLGVGLGVAGWLVGTRGQSADADAPAGASTGFDIEDVDLDEYAADLLTAADAARTAAGQPAWEPAPCAQASAQDRAQALVGAELEHAPLDPVLEACAPQSTAAENLSRAAAPPQDVVDAWMTSPGHRSNIEDPTLTQATTACVRDGDDVVCSLVLVGP